MLSIYKDDASTPILAWISHEEDAEIHESLRHRLDSTQASSDSSSSKNASLLKTLLLPLSDGLLPIALTWWRLFARTAVSLWLTQKNTSYDWQSLLDKAPDHSSLLALSPRDLSTLALHLQENLIAEAEQNQTTVPELLSAWNPAWQGVGRITLHLAENPRNPEFPFAFLATYASQVNARGNVSHLPLSKAIKELANHPQLLAQRLLPLQKATQKSPFLAELWESQRIFRALGWTPNEAAQFLNDAPRIEEAGIVIKVPNWWKNSKPPQPEIQVTLEQASAEKGHMGLQSLLRFQARASLMGQPLSQEELDSLLQSDAPLVTLKGQWVALDSQKWHQTLALWKEAEKAQERGIPLSLGLRMLAGYLKNPSIKSASLDPSLLPSEFPKENHLSSVSPVPEVTFELSGALASQIEALKFPEKLPTICSIPGLRATLRHYQSVGVTWLSHCLSVAGGALLADDMGLGKTLQVLALMAKIWDERPLGSQAYLFVVPASLIGNWEAEHHRFTPEIPLFIYHGKAKQEALPEEGLILTTYTTLAQSPKLLKRVWHTVILDEAHTIKNPSAQITRACQKIQAQYRIALSGTPIENRLSDLWSLFQFILPGLLGPQAQFSEEVRRMKDSPEGFSPLRKLTAPFILRRLKTDPNIAPELPPKIIVPAPCALTPKQIRFYQRVLKQLERDLLQTETLDEAAREPHQKGAILSALLRLKQVCNHPSLWSGDGQFLPEESGKMQRLGELATEMAARGDRLLVFTQFREMTLPIAEFLSQIWNRQGAILHGGVSAEDRTRLVERFQKIDGPPFLVLSLKAGGTGLTLTRANQVIHFDRWWNPAVEDQASDRAYRIGQKNRVMIHPFVCRGTIEEKIDRLLQEKRFLASELWQDQTEDQNPIIEWLGSMNSRQLLETFSVDPLRAE